MSRDPSGCTIVNGSFNVVESASVFSIVNRRAKLFSFTICFFWVVLIKAGTYPLNVFIRLGISVLNE